MSAAAPATTDPNAGPPPANWQELLARVEKFAPQGKTSWLNLQNLWGIAVLVALYVGPKFDRAFVAMDAVIEIKTAALAIAESTKLQTELLAKMHATDLRQEEKIDALLQTSKSKE
jgi:hypothetical protein